MARQTGSANFAGTLEVLAGGPLDARSVVKTKDELTMAGSFPYPYIGMQCFVLSEQKRYTLIANDTTDLTSWREDGSGGASTVVYQPGGSFSFVNLPAPSENNLGFIYDVTDDFTTTSAFIEGAGHDYPAGTNVAVCNAGTESSPVYKYDVFTGMLSGYQKKMQYGTMPSPTASLVGQIYQYTGTTSEFYTNGHFYEVIEDPENAGSYIYNEVRVQEGGSGSLGQAITAAIDVGGIDAGDTFTTGTSYDDMWDALLNPTLYPTFTAPSASLSYTADSYYAVGATIAAKTGTVTYDAGAITLNGTKQNNRGGAATGYALASSGADTEYSGSSESSGTFSVSALTRSTKGSITLTATVNYAQGPQPVDSKGNNYGEPLASGSVTATKTMNFILPYYYGASSSSTIADFTGLTQSVTAKGQKSFKYTTNNQYMVFVYDSSYGNLSSILDPNSFETISGWTKNTVTVGGFSYYVYVSNSPTTDTNAQFTFKY